MKTGLVFGICVASPLFAIAFTGSSAAGIAAHVSPAFVPVQNATVSAQTSAPAGTLPVDGGYKIGDLADGRPLVWSSISESDARSNVFLIPIAKDGRVVGFVRSDDFFAEPASPDASRQDTFQTMTIVDETGTTIGHFEQGVPVLEGQG